MDDVLRRTHMRIAMRAVLNKTGVPPMYLDRILGGDAQNAMRECLAPARFSDEGLERVGGLLSLEHVPEIKRLRLRTPVMMNGRIYSDTICNGEVYVTVDFQSRKDFGDAEGFQQYLREHNIDPTGAFQYCNKSFGIEDSPGFPVMVHFDCRHEN